MLNISKQIHAGWDNTAVSSVDQILPEAEIMPDGTSSTELKKFERFTSKHSNIITIDNVPMPGFTLYDVNKKSYSNPESTWLVIDPRGFMARISNKNLANILRVSGITEGLIQQKCVWAREDSDTKLTLVPLSSTDYEKAVDNTELLDSKVSIKSVNIGDTVLLQNGLQGRYMGVLSIYSKMEKTYNNVIKSSVQLRKQIVEVMPGKFHYGTDVKILKILQQTPSPMTREDSMAYINNCIDTNPNVYFSQQTKFTPGYQQSYKHITCVSVHAEPKIKFDLVEINRTEAENLFYLGRKISYSGGLLLEFSTGVSCVVDYPWWGSARRSDIDAFNVENVIDIDDTKIVLEKRNVSYPYANGNLNTKTYSLDNFKKFYKIVKNVRGLTYI